MSHQRVDQILASDSDRERSNIVVFCEGPTDAAWLHEDLPTAEQDGVSALCIVVGASLNPREHSDCSSMESRFASQFRTLLREAASLSSGRTWPRTARLGNVPGEGDLAGVTRGDGHRHRTGPYLTRGAATPLQNVRRAVGDLVGTRFPREREGPVIATTTGPFLPGGSPLQSSPSPNVRPILPTPPDQINGSPAHPAISPHDALSRFTLSIPVFPAPGYKTCKTSANAAERPRTSEQDGRTVVDHGECVADDDKSITTGVPSPLRTARGDVLDQYQNSVRA
jgi:hypothetical protein